MGEYLPSLIPMRLREVTPLEITQPAGVGFDLDGHLLSWQNWQLRLGFNHREGLVLHQVGYRDNGRLRPVAHRLSFAEMVVPYRDASPDHYRRTAFDIGEWGLGFMTTSLSLGCDCLGEITYLDAVVHDSRGEPVTIPNAICIHEEDSGVGWKHVDERAGGEVRRARRLVVSFHVTVANYEYLVYWRFYQDGNIECEVRATGILVTSHTAAPGSRPANGTLVDHGIYAPFHQHSSWPGSTSMWTGQPTPSTPQILGPRRPATPKTRTGWTWWCRAPRCVPRRRGNRITTGARSAAGRS
jgi:primary-amine oxidase